MSSYQIWRMTNLGRHLLSAYITSCRPLLGFNQLDLTFVSRWTGPEFLHYTRRCWVHQYSGPVSQSGVCRLRPRRGKCPLTRLGLDRIVNTPGIAPFCCFWSFRQKLLYEGTLSSSIDFYAQTWKIDSTLTDDPRLPIQINSRASLSFVCKLIMAPFEKGLLATHSSPVPRMAFVCTGVGSIDVCLCLDLTHEYMVST